MRIKLFENFDGRIEFSQAVKDCFQDLLDDSKAEIQNTTDFGEYDAVIECFLPPKNLETNSFSKFISHEKKYHDSLLEVNHCIERLRQVADVEFDFEYELYENGDKTCSIVLLFSIGSENRGQFYKVNPDGKVSIDYDDLKNILGIPSSTDFSRSTDGKKQTLKIYFKTPEAIDEDGYELIEKMLKLKVGDKDLVTERDWTYSYPPTKKDLAKFKIRKNQDKSGGGYYAPKVHYIEFSLNPELIFSYY